MQLWRTIRHNPCERWPQSSFRENLLWLVGGACIDVWTLLGCTHYRLFLQRVLQTADAGVPRRARAPGDRTPCSVSFRARSVDVGGNWSLTLAFEGEMPDLWILETTTEVYHAYAPFAHPGVVLRDYRGGVSITDAAKHWG